MLRGLVLTHHLRDGVQNIFRRCLDPLVLRGRSPPCVAWEAEGVQEQDDPIGRQQVGHAECAFVNREVLARGVVERKHRRREVTEHRFRDTASCPLPLEDDRACLVAVGLLRLRWQLTRR